MDFTSLPIKRVAQVRCGFGAGNQSGLWGAGASDGFTCEWPSSPPGFCSDIPVGEGLPRAFLLFAQKKPSKPVLPAIATAVIVEI